jgi:predicted amidohydrolase YtcJ
MLERYPKIVGVHRDAKGQPTGRLGGVANLTMWYEYWPVVPPEQIAPYYRMEAEEVAAQGITTFSTRVEPNHLAAYGWLHANDEMPLRLAYTLETFARANDTEAIASRMMGLHGATGNRFWGAGDDKMWIIGVTPDSIDSTAGVAGSCVRKEYPREVPDFPLWRFQFYGPHGVCRLNDPEYHDAEVIKMAAKYGYRISGMHVAGDRGLDEFMDIVEQAAKEYPAVLQARYSADHCLIVHDDLIQRAKKLNIMFSCAPKYLYGGAKSGVGAMKVLYGEEDAGNSVIPFKSMIDQGVHSAIELDEHAFHPFLALQVVINRKDVDGKVWGPKQAVSRQEALYLYTRWSSEYVLKENFLGSIEPKKAGDFIVMNKDYLTVPEDEIGRLDPVLTVMGGKITYSNPEFAASQGLPTVGYQGSRARWKRGTPEDAKRGFNE